MSWFANKLRQTLRSNGEISAKIRLFDSQPVAPQRTLEANISGTSGITVI